MSTAAVTDAVEEPPKKKLRLSKKLIVMLGSATLLLAAIGGGAVYWVKHQAATEEAAAETEDGEEQARAPSKPAKKEHKTTPIFVPLDTFTVNLADKDAERFAQIGVTLEIEDAKVGDQIKTYMPAIRNGVLMILAHKTSQELLQRTGKDKLAREIQAETALALGLELNPAANGGASDEAGAGENPVRKVYFSNFIIQ